MRGYSHFVDADLASNVTAFCSLLFQLIGEAFLYTLRQCISIGLGCRELKTYLLN
jgi:hypothetical protein